MATAPVCDVNSVAAADRAPLLPATRADATPGSNFSEVSSAAAQISYNLNSVIGYDINSAVNRHACATSPTTTSSSEGSRSYRGDAYDNTLGVTTLSLHAPL